MKSVYITLTLTMALLAGCNDDQEPIQNQEKSAVSACMAVWSSADHGSQYLQGTVAEINGTLPNLQASYITGKARGETVKIGGATYLLSVQTPSGIYFVQAVDDRTNDEYSPYFQTEPQQTVSNLANAIKVGTQIEFATHEVAFWDGRVGRCDYFQDRKLFSPSRIGIVEADNLRLSLK